MMDISKTSPVVERMVAELATMEPHDRIGVVATLVANTVAESTSAVRGAVATEVLLQAIAVGTKVWQAKAAAFDPALVPTDHH